MRRREAAGRLRRRPAGSAAQSAPAGSGDGAWRRIACGKRRRAHRPGD